MLRKFFNPLFKYITILNYSEVDYISGIKRSPKKEKGEVKSFFQRSIGVTLRDCFFVFFMLVRVDLDCKLLWCFTAFS